MWPFKKSGNPSLSTPFSLGWLASVSVLGKSWSVASGWAIAALSMRVNKQIAGTIAFLMDRLEPGLGLLRGCQGMQAMTFLDQIVEVPLDWTQHEEVLGPLSTITQVQYVSTPSKAAAVNKPFESTGCHQLSAAPLSCCRGLIVSLPASTSPASWTQLTDDFRLECHGSVMIL